MTIREQLEKMSIQEAFDSFFDKDEEDAMLLEGIVDFARKTGYVLNKALNHGKVQGIFIGMNKMIKAMYDDNMPLETIAKITHSDLKEVKDIVKKENSNLIEQLAQMNESEIIKAYFNKDDDKSLIQQAINDTEKEGYKIVEKISEEIAIGIITGKLVIMSDMYKHNISIERIAKITDMNIEKVKKIIDLLFKN